MLNLAGNFLLILVLVVWNSSCLKRPERRAPRLNNTGGNLMSCAGLDAAARALHTRCRDNLPNPNKTPDPHATLDPYEPPAPESSPDPNNTTPGTNTGDTGTNTMPDDTTVEPIDTDIALADISVNVICGVDSYGCLYSDDKKKYWLQCEIKSGGCGKGLHYRYETEKGAAFKNSRDSVCRDGNKTVADLAQGKIKLECKTDQDVLRSFVPKKAELILNQSHLENQHLCVVTNAGVGQRIAFKDVSLSIRPGTCGTPNPASRVEFQTQLSFSW